MDKGSHAGNEGLDGVESGVQAQILVAPVRVWFSFSLVYLFCLAMLFKSFSHLSLSSFLPYTFSFLLFCSIALVTVIFDIHKHVFTDHSSPLHSSSSMYNTTTTNYINAYPLRYNVTRRCFLSSRLHCFLL